MFHFNWTFRCLCALKSGMLQIMCCGFKAHQLDNTVLYYTALYNSTIVTVVISVHCKVKVLEICVMLKTILKKQ